MALFATWEIVTMIILGLLFLISSSVTSFIIFARYRWPFIVYELENISGRGYVLARKDRAKLVRFGNGGEELFRLKKKKTYRVAYGKRGGLRLLLFAKGSDGYYYNIVFGDLDKKLLEMGIMPVHGDMRYASSSVRKGIDNRYDDKTWIEKHQAVLYFGMFTIALLVFGGVIWFTLDKSLEISQVNAQAMVTTKEVAELLKQVLSGIVQVRNGGSGLIT